MHLIGHQTVADRLPWPRLIEALREEFAAPRIDAPPRQVLTIPLPGGGTASLLMMPAWEGGKAIGLKAVTFFPDNAAREKATINAGYLMFDGADGRALAAIDGDALTARRTAATSALAADFLARRDAAVLLVCGTGQVASVLAEAHASVRPYREILIWGRDAEKARARAGALADRGLPARFCDDLEAGCRRADVVSTATAATVPFLRGEWLAEGSHLDLIGAFKADMRECDTAAITQGRVFVDGRDGAMLSGDLAGPAAEGAFRAEAIAGDLSEVIQGRAGRRSEAERTVFKSVGLASEDLVAAMLAAQP
ncbi:ornithine cyclodeaminase family protein [Falsirhodobacter halotolerans]|uniref:ornithine cyclodeaminase family protein n=1 Tax=Falsirhodobacter halotolerans TaxID=1146892 RepID=UPI001FCF98DB|nr:ornithine cyclodeaminase family protein [Falsirhodobacter halotolerans]MCJ8140857.1 ornithine cyclodeaminase family protein [Falsirhodobacter halotolerans]